MNIQETSVHNEERTWLKKIKCLGPFVKDFSQLAAVLIGIVAGIIALPYTDPSNLPELIPFPEELFVRLMQMISVGTIASSLIAGISEIPTDVPKKIGVRAAVYFCGTTLAALVTGISLVMWLNPGADMTPKDEEFVFFSFPSFLNLTEAIVTENLVLLGILRFDNNWIDCGSGPTQQWITTRKNSTEVRVFRGNINSLGLFYYCCVWGVILKMVHGKPFVKFMEIVLKVIAQMVAGFQWFLLVVLPFMAVNHVISVHDWQDAYKLAKFLFVVLFGFAIHAFIVLPTIYCVTVRCSPLRVIQGVLPALKTAFLSSSSSASLPQALQGSEDSNRIQPVVSHFMLPVGARFSMNGSVLYVGAAAVFIAQLSQQSKNLCLNKILEIGALSVLLSTEPAGIRGVMSAIFLQTAVGFPTREAVLLVAVEGLLSRFSSCLNVLGNCIGAAVINELSKKELQAHPGQVQHQ